MKLTLQELKNAASELSADERVKLAGFLLRTLNEQGNGAVGAAWTALAKQRDAEVPAGKVLGALTEMINRELAQSMQRMPELERPTIHYSELPESAAGSSHAAEWNFYRRQVERLLAEGNEGKWVLIKGEQIIGIWDREEEAYAAAIEKFFRQPVLIHQIQTRELVLRGPTFTWLCRS